MGDQSGAEVMEVEEVGGRHRHMKLKVKGDKTEVRQQKKAERSTALQTAAFQLQTLTLKKIPLAFSFRPLLLPLPRRRSSSLLLHVGVLIFRSEIKKELGGK